MILANKHAKRERVCFKDNCFNVDLAMTNEEKQKGLMYIEGLEQDKGMLFVYDGEGVYSFWMKNVKIPLDIIWINSNKEVVYISENSLPCLEDPCPSINPGKNAKYILEINGGMSEKMGLNVGDKLDIIIN